MARNRNKRKHNSPNDAVRCKHRTQDDDNLVGFGDEEVRQISSPRFNWFQKPDFVPGAQFSWMPKFYFKFQYEMASESIVNDLSIYDQSYAVNTHIKTFTLIGSLDSAWPIMEASGISPTDYVLSKKDGKPCLTFHTFEKALVFLYLYFCSTQKGEHTDF